MVTRIRSGLDTGQYAAPLQIRQPNPMQGTTQPKTTKVKILKCKFQNLGENGAEAFFTWEPRSGCFVPHVQPELEEAMPWE